MDANPTFWTPQVLDEKGLNDICNWLFAWQKACVSCDSIASDFFEEGEKLPSQRLDPAFKVAMGHIESLIRHIRATYPEANKFKRGDVLVCNTDVKLTNYPILGETYCTYSDSFMNGVGYEVVQVLGLVGAWPVSWFRKYWDTLVVPEKP